SVVVRSAAVHLQSDLDRVAGNDGEFRQAALRGQCALRIGSNGTRGIRDHQLRVRNLRAVHHIAFAVKDAVPGVAGNANLRIYKSIDGDAVVDIQIFRIDDEV